MSGDPKAIIESLDRFHGLSLTATLSQIERAVRGVTADDCGTFLQSANVNGELWAAAAEMKRLAGQINVVIHAAGILLCLPRILEPGERVESVSLGAGNTGRHFDLETNLRVAEFKFIRWRGHDTIRQNSVFKDFFALAEHATPKRKFLYLLGTEHAMKFMKSRRSISSVMSGGVKMNAAFAERFGDRYRTVGDYYAAHSSTVAIQDVSPWLSGGLEELVADDEAAE